MNLVFENQLTSLGVVEEIITLVLAEQGIQGMPGTSGAAANYSLAFGQSALSIASILPAVHGRNATPISVMVIDDQGLQIIPDSIDLSNPNAIAVGLQSFAPITGQWLLLASF